ncbi:extracellular solute-binding protein [Enterococcus diestrammenae]|uniref:extracellular solute-binding protein n=1 Tax=Enterococcus diestrammenae TaxID=1155073 RepID=UPI0022DEC036|nr:extracellular solute-binding protein [Enterococcus diestrammenae]
MKFKKMGTVMLAAVATVALAACGNSNNDKGSDKESSDIVTKIDKETKITFWHAMNDAQEDALEKIVADFQKENPNIKVTLQNQGQYSDMQAKINSTLQSPKDLPTITQAYPGWLYNAAQEDMLVDLNPYMEDKTIGWAADKQEEIRPALLKGAEIDGKQYGIPFNKSTEALVYNADMLKEYGVEVPTTMEEFAQACKDIYEKSNHEVVGGGFDSLNNYYTIGMENKGVEFTKDLKLDSDESKEVINYYLDGIKDGSMRIAGSDKYLSGPFANEKVAMFIGSIAGEGYVKSDTEGKFEYGVAPRPDKINIQQGTDVYMFAEATPEQRTAAYMLLKYMSQPDVQLYWAEQTGYMPIVESVLESDEYKSSKETKVPAILEDATKDLFALPVTENADPAYNQVRTIMENILANPKDDTDKMIKQGVSELESAWNQ